MGERKVLNFYISPDFDVSLLPKVKRDWSKGCEIRMMLPFSLRCNTCGEYMYAGKKFNSQKELIKGEDYLGIKKFRFMIKCTLCSSVITFKTDPKNSDYECESGASRNFENWRETEAVLDQAKKEREEEDKLDAMKSLENRTLDSKLEMDVLDALDEMKAINHRHESIDTKSLINALKNKAELASQVRTSAEIDEEEIKNVQFKKKAKIIHLPSQSEEDVTAPLTDPAVSYPGNVVDSLLGALKSSTSAPKIPSVAPIVVKKIKRVLTTDTTSNNSTSAVAATTTINDKSLPNALPLSNSLDSAVISASAVLPAAQSSSLALLGGYDSDED